MNPSTRKAGPPTAFPASITGLQGSGTSSEDLVVNGCDFGSVLFCLLVLGWLCKYGCDALRQRSTNVMVG